MGTSRLLTFIAASCVIFVAHTIIFRNRNILLNSGELKQDLPYADENHIFFASGSGMYSTDARFRQDARKLPLETKRSNGVDSLKTQMNQVASVLRSVKREIKQRENSRKSPSPSSETHSLGSVGNSATPRSSEHGKFVIQDQPSHGSSTLVDVITDNTLGARMDRLAAAVREMQEEMRDIREHELASMPSAPKAPSDSPGQARHQSAAPSGATPGSRSMMKPSADTLGVASEARAKASAAVSAEAGTAAAAAAAAAKRDAMAVQFARAVLYFTHQDDEPPPPPSGVPPRSPPAAAPPPPPAAAAPSPPLAAPPPGGPVPARRRRALRLPYRRPHHWLSGRPDPNQDLLEGKGVVVSAWPGVDPYPQRHRCGWGGGCRILPSMLPSPPYLLQNG